MITKKAESWMLISFFLIFYLNYIAVLALKSHKAWSKSKKNIFNMLHLQYI